MVPALAVVVRRTLSHSADLRSPVINELCPPQIDVYVIIDLMYNTFGDAGVEYCVLRIL